MNEDFFTEFLSAA